jgi:hypothetical protein
MTYLLQLLKLGASHAVERGQERLKLPPESVKKIQQMADRMWYSEGRKKITGGTEYYAPLRDHTHSVIGHAGFRKIGNPYRSRLILTTILSGHMKPKGTNIGSFFDESRQVSGIYPTSHLPQKFNRFDPVPNSK